MFYCPEGKAERSEVECADPRCPSRDVLHQTKPERPAWLQLEEEKKHPQLNPDINCTLFLYLEILWEKGKCVIKTCLWNEFSLGPQISEWCNYNYYFTVLLHSRWKLMVLCLHCAFSCSGKLGFLLSGILLLKAHRRGVCTAVNIYCYHPWTESYLI